MRAPTAKLRVSILSSLIAASAVAGATGAATSQAETTPAAHHPAVLAAAAKASAESAAKTAASSESTASTASTVSAASEASSASTGVHAATSPLLKVAATLPKVSATQALKLAESQVGVSENAQGGGTKFHDWYMNSPRAKETVARDGGNVAAYRNAAWCDMFVSWVGAELGIHQVMGWDAYTVQHASWFKDNNRWGEQASPGAVVFFNWKGGKNLHSIEHVGFVIKDNGDGTIKTVEGNTGNGKVEIRTRPTSQVVGYGYPVYTA